MSRQELPAKDANISEWYLEVISRAGLAEYADVKGAIIFRPNGFALWERYQQILDSWFKEGGVQNAYFPLLIPYSYIAKEQEHLEGFSPELAMVTHAGGEELAEPYAIRPTSETIIGKSMSKWVSSYRDLPLKLNQWCNVMRWEKRTYPFLRTSEFLWQEGHTAHASAEEAQEMTLTALNWYRKFFEEVLGIAVYVGMKSAGEKFAGAETTYSIEEVIPDGKALQAATSHYMADHFAKVFEVRFQDKDAENRFAHTTSWGLSTRAIGGLILGHGDDKGLVLPPRLAPTQVVLLPLTNKDGVIPPELEQYVASIAHELRAANIRTVIDSDVEHSFGYRSAEWEVQGIPLRLEIGGRELENSQVTAARRDTLEKVTIGRDGIAGTAHQILEEVQQNLYDRSLAKRNALTTDVESFEQFVEQMNTDRGFLRMLWCESRECEQAIKEKTKATPRVLELERISEREEGVCPHCGRPAARRWLFAQSY